MSWLDTLAIFPRPPDSRPIRQVEQEILDELDFHIEMRTLDNINAGMSPPTARQDAVNRFGDFRRIHQACRRTILGERIMLQRIQAVLTIILLLAVVFIGLEFYRWQETQQATMTQMTKTLDRMEGSSTPEKQEKLLGAIVDAKPPIVVKTMPETGAADVDPALAEIRVTYSKEMMDHRWSWSQTSDETFPETNGDPQYEADGKTCVLPVKLRPGKEYEILLNSDKFKNFRDRQNNSAVPYLLRFKTRLESGTVPSVSQPGDSDRKAKNNSPE